MAPFAVASADPLKLVRQVDFNETVDHGVYRSCSTHINIDFHDSTCRPGTDSATPERSSIIVEITYTFLHNLKTHASVEGVSYCETKPKLVKLASWSIRSGDPNSWHLDNVSPSAADGQAVAILKAEEIGIRLESVREDSFKLTLDLKAEPSPVFDSALWQARRESHRHCIGSLEHP